eukprot:TRINITY_DN34954_c0_g1_i1.p2 TRINITY_DN34954_c0_g1~~TRINITY_DN34954_c0_g1_i1.p2  ORF type:complete len:154 (-),score=1.43 TRINITY_DN34954_c0_g1_i1:156-617(-)
MQRIFKDEYEGDETDRIYKNITETWVYRGNYYFLTGTVHYRCGDDFFGGIIHGVSIISVGVYGNVNSFESYQLYFFGFIIIAIIIIIIFRQIFFFFIYVVFVYSIDVSDAHLVGGLLHRPSQMVLGRTLGIQAFIVYIWISGHMYRVQIVEMV